MIRLSNRRKKDGIRMRLFLARHGETNWNQLNRIQGQTDTFLNENGRKQAKELAERLLEGNYAIDKIYSSRQKRALETAQIVGAALEKSVIVQAGFEEMNMGQWEGFTWPQVKQQFAEEYTVWQVNRRYQETPDGESYQQVLDRVLPVLREIKNKEEGNVLIVTHSAIIMALLSYLHDTPFEEMAKKYKTANANIIEIHMEERDGL